MIVRYGAIGAALALGVARLLHVTGVRMIVQRALPEHSVRVPHMRFLFLALGTSGILQLTTPAWPVPVVLMVNGILGVGLYLVVLWATPWLREDERRLTREAVQYGVLQYRRLRSRSRTGGEQ
jgi:hypothetical protein